ncbi:MAG: hypothetical protein MUC81_13925 [Bacteroidia bacterium]|jgi:hypothetical protein|nr:hypothetical protein [Bacteroidia bacterium]
MPKALLNLLVVVGLSSSLYAQNLVVNGQFTHTNICCEKDAPCSPEGWFSISVHDHQPNILPLNPVLTAGYGDLNSILIETFHTQKPKAYAPACAVTPLALPLEKNKRYELTMYVLPNLLAVSEIQAGFSSTALVDWRKSKPNISFRISKNGLIKRGKKWVKLTATYTANGLENYLFIGVLVRRNQLKTKTLGIQKGMGYYLVDEVSLIAKDTIVSQEAIDSATQFIFGENRRHQFTSACRGSNILFPELITLSPKDSITTLPGILNTKKWVRFNGIKEHIYYLWDMHQKNQQWNQNQLNQLDELVKLLKANPTWKMNMYSFIDDPNEPDFNDEYAAQIQLVMVINYLKERGIDSNRILSSISMGSLMFIHDPLYPKTSAKINNRIEIDWVY